MTPNPMFDQREAHRYFSAHCFNAAWELLEKPDRTADEDEQMVRLCQASLWHWTERDDCQPANLSIGYWQAARIHAILGRPDDARRYGQLCRVHSEATEPFLLAYAYEALARAEKVAGNAELAAEHRARAAALAEQVTDADDKKSVLADLATI